MADTRIESPRSAEQRTAKLAGSSTSQAKNAAGPIGQDFSSLLASLDDLVNMGQPSAAPMAGGVAGEKLAQPDLTEQDALLAAGAQAPWMSLVGQTARLDTQGDTDLRQGAATDFLSGRGSLAQLSHRQAVQVQEQGASAALENEKFELNQPQSIAGKAQPAIHSDASVPLSKNGSGQTHEAEQAAQALDLAEAAAEVKPEVAAHKAQASQRVSLQGMTAVQPQVMEGLKDWLRAVRSPLQDEEGMQAKPGAVQQSSEMQAAAAVVGAAMGAAGAGMQGGSQSGSDLSQNLAGQDVGPSEREQEVSEQVAFWVHQKTQNAALSIQHEGRPIQVQVQLQGQEAHVRFAADDEQARQLLADGQAQLRDLLQAQGLSLSGVSVDAGGSQGQSNTGAEGDGTARAQARVARVSVNAGDTIGAEAVLGRSAAQVSSNGVDLFV